MIVEVGLEAGDGLGLAQLGVQRVQELHQVPAGAGPLSTHIVRHYYMFKMFK